ncbi:GGDEF domain-containing protein [Massilia sp. H-1]|nr:GGDEF domain-containing protein [Massilia sp. H-1]
MIIVEPSEQSGEVEAVARKILAALGAPFSLGGHQLYVSASIGVSLYPDARRPKHPDPQRRHGHVPRQESRQEWLRGVPV